MEYHQNVGPLYAARQDDAMEQPLGDFLAIDLARQLLEWETFTGATSNTINTQTYLGSAFHDHHPEDAYYYPEANHTPSFSTPSSLFASPATTMTDSILENPSPVLTYELPADMMTTLWSDDDTLCLLPDLMPGLPPDTSLEWAPPSSNVWMTTGVVCGPSAQLVNKNWAQDPASWIDDPPPPPPPPLPQAISSQSAPEQKTNPIPAQNHACATCAATFATATKLRTHTNKHTKPFRCTAPSCAYAAAEKKSLQRHVAARAKWDEGHRGAAEGLGVRHQVRYRCARPGCGYVTVRDDNLRRHGATCPV